MSLSRKRSITMNSMSSPFPRWPRDPKADSCLCNRRRLTFDPRQTGIETGPDRRGLGPDCCRGRRQIRIVKRSDAHEVLIWALLVLAEDGRAALGAEAPVHDRAAVGPDHKVGQLTG